MVGSLTNPDFADSVEVHERECVRDRRARIRPAASRSSPGRINLDVDPPVGEAGDDPDVSVVGEVAARRQGEVGVVARGVAKAGVSASEIETRYGQVGAQVSVTDLVGTCGRPAVGEGLDQGLGPGVQRDRERAGQRHWLGEAEHDVDGLAHAIGAVRSCCRDLRDAGHRRVRRPETDAVGQVERVCPEVPPVRHAVAVGVGLGAGRGQGVGVRRHIRRSAAGLRLSSWRVPASDSSRNQQHSKHGLAPRWRGRGSTHTPRRPFAPP